MGLTLLHSRFFKEKAMKPVVTERTSKRYKGRMLLGGLVTCAGVIILVGGDNPLMGAGLFVAGLVIYALGRFGSWWNHG